MDFSLAQSSKRANKDEVTHVKCHKIRLKLYKTEKFQNKLVIDQSTVDVFEILELC